jgi:hypothetical protein
MAGPLQTTMFNGVSDFYNGVATQSLRFAYTSAETWLARTPDAGNRKTHTLSVWVKRSGISASQNILEARGSGDSGNTDIWFDANDKLEVSGGSTYFRVTDRVFRDINAWYHLVFRFDTTQGTANNRLLIYVNGSVITSFNTNNAYSQNTDYGIGGNVEHRIGDGYGHFDGYMARYEFIDGLSLGPENFGETKNGIWVAKAYGGSYGTNGHKLEFKETGTDADANGLGADTSGNNNHYTPTAILGHDSAFPDCPENNFATLLGESSESSDYQSYANGTYYEGNLNVKGVGGWTNGKSNFLVNSGKWYVECRVNAWQANNYIRLGVFARPARTYDEYFILGNGTGQIDGSARNVVSSFSTGVIIQIALDLENNNIFFGIDNTWSNSATASEIVAGTATNAFASGSQVPTGDGHNYGFYFNPHTATTNITVNFGQDSSFGGVETATTNTDSEGFGTFQYEPPAGFLAMCSANITKPTIGPDSATQADDYHNTVLWDGNGSSNAITGVGFKPDWLWSKDLTGTENHVFLDSSRGLTHRLSSNSDDNETDDSNAVISSFDTDGFTLTQYHDSNANSSRNVGWCWKANGGVATASGSESGDNPAHSVQANPTAGFSIVTFTGTQAVGTVPHGLGAVPKMIILKNREVDGNGWIVYHEHVDQTDFVFLNNTNTRSDNANRFNDTKPTSTVFTLGADANINDDGVGVVAYVFADVEGYSKFGHYDANGNDNGTVVFTGFRPAFVMLKNIDNNTNGGNWVIMDDTRLGDDVGAIPPILSHIKANSSDAEFDSGSYPLADFLANGFKLRLGGTGSGLSRNINNANGNDYIYMAFAHSPFKYANAF